MTARLALVAVVGLAAAACSNEQYLVVTVDAHANVHGAAALLVTQRVGTEARTDTLKLGSHTFPATFSIVAPPPGTALDLQLEADDASGAAVALGEATVPPDAGSASVALVGTDFAVNTDYAMDQFVSNDYEANGLQLAATPDGNWTVAFRDNCGGASNCSIYARRFDSAGQPVSTSIAAGTNQFPVSPNQTDMRATPAIAAAGSTTLVLWDFGDLVDTGVGVACRAIDATGAASSGQLSITTDDADVVTASSLSNQNVAVSWQVGVAPSAAIHTIVVKPDCSTIPSSPVAISVTQGTTEGPNRSDIASNGSTVLYAWVVDGAVYVRTANNAVSVLGNELALIQPTSTLEVSAVRVAALGDGFAVVVRWVNSTDFTMPGKMELYRIDAKGTMLGTPTLISDQTLSDFPSGEQAFGVAARTDGALLVVWHVCDAAGDASSCVVYGRMFRPTGVPVGDAFTIPTTKGQGQSSPSAVALDGAFAVAWNDVSMTPPDTQGSAVRARIIYPPYDDATAVLGAACGGTRPACGPGLVCAMGSDGAERCYEGCTPGGPPPLCPHGGSCDTASSACTY